MVDHVGLQEALAVLGYVMLMVVILGLPRGTAAAHLCSEVQPLRSPCHTAIPSTSAQERARLDFNMTQLSTEVTYSERDRS